MGRPVCENAKQELFYFVLVGRLIMYCTSCISLLNRMTGSIEEEDIFY